jgi:hypothetical protein
MNRSRRRVLLAGLASLGVALGASDVLLVTGHAAQDDSQAVNFSLFNGQVTAGADREQVFTSTNPGFDQGAVNNFYPLAQVGVTTAGTSAAASPADTGPLAQAVVGGQQENQPQYVRAQSPGNQNPPGYSAGPASASASVTSASGTASATCGAVGNTTTAPFGSQPDGSDGGSARTTAYFDSSLGFVTIGDARLHHASYSASGQGQSMSLVIDNLHVMVQVSSDGLGHFAKAVSVAVGDAYVVANGTQIPVTIDQNGVTVAGTQNSAPVDLVQTMSDTLNSQLAAVGIRVHAIAPVVTQQGDNLHVDADGVVVEVVQPQSVGPVPLTTVPNVGGVPQQWVRHTLGVVTLDNEAVSAPAQPDLGTSSSTDLGGGGSAVPSTSTTIINNAGATAPGPQPSAPTTPASAAKRPALVPVTAVLTSKPMPAAPLVLAYVAWQALMIALVGALYLHRSALRRTP